MCSCGHFYTKVNGYFVQLAHFSKDMIHNGLVPDGYQIYMLDYWAYDSYHILSEHPKW